MIKVLLFHNVRKNHKEKKKGIKKGKKVLTGRGGCGILIERSENGALKGSGEGAGILKTIQRD